MKKTLILTGLVLVGVVWSSVPVFAESSASASGKTMRDSMRPSQVLHLNTLCAQAVTERVSRLNTVHARISGLTKLSDTQKQQLGNTITQTISGLQTLQNQCNTDATASNPAALKNDYHSVFTQYRIYAEFLPQINLLIAADTLGTTANKLSDFAVKLQQRIQKGGNDTHLGALLSDMQAKLSDANSQVNSITTSVVSLTPQSYDSNPTGVKTTFQTARANLKTGRSDVDAAWKDAKQIVSGLKISLTPTPGS